MFWLNSAAPERVTHVAVDRGASDEKTRRRSGQQIKPVQPRPATLRPIASHKGVIGHGGCPLESAADF